MIDARNAEDILDEIHDLAQTFTPEWRFNSDNPDAGTALALIWADMLSGTVSRLNEIPQKLSIALLSALGAQNRPPLHSKGMVAFKAEKFALLHRGTKIAAKDDNLIIFETVHDIAISPAVITDFFAVSPELDVCCKNGSCFNGSFNETEIPKTLFDFSAPNVRIWTISHSFMFDVTKTGMVSLKFDCGVNTDFVLEYLSGVSWEYLCGEEWFDIQRVWRSDDKLCLAMPTCTEIRFHLSGIDVPENIELYSVKLYANNQYLTPDIMYSGDIELIESGFFPFKERFLLYDEFYIACDEAFLKTGADVEIAFEMRMEKFPIEDYPLPEIKYKKIMRENDFKQPEQYVISISDISIEYCNGRGWTSLSAVKKDFRTYEIGCSSSCFMQFKIPADMDSMWVNAYDKRYVRVRVTGVKNAYKMYGVYHSPYIENVRIRYWFDSGTAPDTLTVYHDMEQKEYKLNSPLAERSFSITAEYFAFDYPFTQGTMFWELLHSSENTPSLAWEYYTGNGWCALEVNDETNNFAKSGLFTYSVNAPCALNRIFGKTAYWMRAVDIDGYYNDKTQSRPIIKSCWTNVVEINCLTEGKDGNLPEYHITQMLNPISEISEVVNPFPTSGGYGSETDIAAIRRYSKRFSHMNRAVSISDYVNLAYEASPKVIKCAGFPNTDAAACNADRHICLIILQEDYQNENFDNLEREISQYIMERCELTQKREFLHIMPPQFVHLDIMVHISVAETKNGMTEYVSNRIREFVDPIHGGFDGSGWDIGTILDATQISKALIRETGIVVQKIDISYSLSSVPVGLSELQNKPFILPLVQKIQVLNKEYTVC